MKNALLITTLLSLEACSGPEAASASFIGSTETASTLASSEAEARVSQDADSQAEQMPPTAESRAVYEAALPVLLGLVREYGMQAKELCSGAGTGFCVEYFQPEEIKTPGGNGLNLIGAVNSVFGTEVRRDSKGEIEGVIHMTGFTIPAGNKSCEVMWARLEPTDFPQINVMKVRCLDENQITLQDLPKGSTNTSEDEKALYNYGFETLLSVE